MDSTLFHNNDIIKHMFDDQIQDNQVPSATGEPPVGLPTAPIAPVAPAPASAEPTPSMPTPFAPVSEEGDFGLPPEMTDAITSPAPAMQMETNSQTPSYSRKKRNGLKIVFFLFAGLAVIAAAGFIAYKLIVQQPADVSDTIPVVDEDQIPPEDEVIIKEPEPVAQDSDGDGLTDEEEAKYGTNAMSSDTDQDGLMDREEVQVYGTDPLEPDTDGDTFLDGQEVANGFNPNGDGKLFELPK